MDFALKVVLDEMQKRFTESMEKQFVAHDAKWEKHFGDLEQKVEHAKDARVDAMESSLKTAAAEFDAWKPRADSLLRQLIIFCIHIEK